MPPAASRASQAISPCQYASLSADHHKCGRNPLKKGAYESHPCITAQTRGEGVQNQSSAFAQHLLFLTQPPIGHVDTALGCLSTRNADIRSHILGHRHRRRDVCNSHKTLRRMHGMRHEVQDDVDSSKKFTSTQVHREEGSARSGQHRTLPQVREYLPPRSYGKCDWTSLTFDSQVLLEARD